MKPAQRWQEAMAQDQAVCALAEAYARNAPRAVATPYSAIFQRRLALAWLDGYHHRASRFSHPRTTYSNREVPLVRAYRDGVRVAALGVHSATALLVRRREPEATP